MAEIDPALQSLVDLLPPIKVDQELDVTFESRLSISDGKKTWSVTLRSMDLREFKRVALGGLERLLINGLTDIELRLNDLEMLRAHRALESAGNVTGNDGNVASLT